MTEHEVSRHTRTYSHKSGEEPLISFRKITPAEETLFVMLLCI